MSKNTQILKTKFLCKTTTTTGNKHINKTYPRFTEGKWYDGEYETWSWDGGYETNGGWRSYWIINDIGTREKIDRTFFSIIFESDISKLRDEKINQILKK